MPSIGPWRLRFLVIDKDTNLSLYLTSHGVNKVVTIDPESSDGQKVMRFNISVDCMINLDMVPQWFALPIEGKKDWYIITPEPDSNCPPGLARKDRDSDIVILAEQPDEWRLQYIPIDIANGDVNELVFLFVFHFPWI